MTEETSIWKKELSLRRRRPVAASSVTAAPVAESPSAPTSIWKKELTLRPRRAEKFVSPHAATEPAEAKSSVWKRELRFRKLSAAPRRPEAPAVETPRRTENWATPKRDGWVELPAPIEAASVSLSRFAPDLDELELSENWPLPERELFEPHRAESMPELMRAQEREPEPERIAPLAAPAIPPIARPVAAAFLDFTERAPAAIPELSPLEGGEEAATAAPATEWPASEEPALEATAVESQPFDQVAHDEPVIALPAVDEAAEPEPEPEPEPALAAPTTAKPKPRRRRGAQAGEVVGLRIGSTQIVAALVDNGANGPELVRLARKPLARGVVVAGEVREPAALASALRELFAEHKLPRRAVRVGIASNRIGVRTLEVPVIADSKLRDNAIRFRAQELLSIPLSEAVIDHFVIGETATDEGPGHRMLLAFAHRELIDRYVEACKGARLKLTRIDFDAFALLRAVSDPLEAGAIPDRATVAVAIGHERTIFAVAEGEVCDYTRVLEWGGSSLTIGLARALNMTPSQAEPIKHGLSLVGDLAGSDLSAVQIEAGRDAMRSELQVLARELLASLQYYQSRPGSLAIGEILLTGGAAQLAGAELELERLLGVTVRQADPYRHVELGKKAVRFADPGSVSVAIGLGIDGPGLDG